MQMQIDMKIYMEGTVEGRLPQLTRSNSPLKLERKLDDFYILLARDTILDGFFVYETPGSEIMSEDQLHIESQKALGFSTGSHLSYGKCNMNPQKAQSFKNVVDYVTREGIPFYMTARDESGEEIMVRGYNPRTNTEVSNPRFTKTLPELLK